MPKRHKPKFCLVKGNGCECGRNGWAIKFCRKPLPSERMAEIMEELRVRVRTQGTLDNVSPPK